MFTYFWGPDRVYGSPTQPVLTLKPRNGLSGTHVLQGKTKRKSGQTPATLQATTFILLILISLHDLVVLEYHSSQGSLISCRILGDIHRIKSHVHVTHGAQPPSTKEY